MMAAHFVDRWNFEGGERERITAVHGSCSVSSAAGPKRILAKHGTAAPVRDVRYFDGGGEL